MIYLDYNSTTPVANEVLQAMLPYFKDKFGNASSRTHQYGWMAKDGVETASDQICQLINCDPKEVVYTSGATESINLAMKGVFEIYKRKGNHIITAKTEHKAVLDCCDVLKKMGARITFLDVDQHGLIDTGQLKKEISDQTILVAIMYVNNETGIIQPIHEIANIVHGYQSIFMCDATQAFGKVPLDMETDRIDLMAFSAHKICGPKGVGGLYVRRKKPRVILAPQIVGGGHQRGLRSGTLNVPGIAGMGAAAELAENEMDQDALRIGVLRDQLETGLKHLTNVSFNGASGPRLYNTSNICFQGIRAEDIINTIKTTIAVSTGSACTSEDQTPSHVLSAMGLSETNAYSSVRFSLGKYTTEEDVKQAVRIISEGIKQKLSAT
ncbi:MAG: cysteine desulfurase [Bacteroidetes bacterium]|nr:cysteine desulfurase [Bacteroidota bacterium]